MIIGVNLVPQLPVPDSELKTVFGIGSRCFDIAALNNIKPELALCDYVIEPMEISKYSRFSISNIDKMYQIGYAETMKNIEEIKGHIRR